MSSAVSPPQVVDLPSVPTLRAAFKTYWRGLLLLFVGIWLPLLGFAALASEVREGEALFFDSALLHWTQAWHGPTLNAVFLFFSRIGFAWGVVPCSVGLVLLLLWKRSREWLFSAFALGGSGLLNTLAKQSFQRDRPTLWTSLAPEHTYSFPSGHAMGSMALAAVLLLLVWRTRWRWPMAIAMGVFVLMVGASRIYLGVHYPSDILGGWAVALAWVLGVYYVFRKASVATYSKHTAD